ncbi:hypothetical protein ACFL10_00580 [Patescibacteria group bacterium]
MRLPEHSFSNGCELNPEGYLATKFNPELLEHIESNEEKVTHKQKKSQIREFCITNAHHLGLTADKGRQASMFFFSLLYENPEKAMKMWHILYLMSENASNSALVRDLFIELVTLNEGDSSIIWRFVHGIIKGFYEIEKVDVSGDKIYFAKVPSDSAERENDPKRSETINSLKLILDESVLQKPVQEVNLKKERLSEIEEGLLEKIYTFLQEDSDFLIASADTTQDEVKKYFIDKITKLGNFCRDLEQGIKTVRRRKAYKAYLDEALDTYIKPLFAYCVKLKSDKRKNPFTADIIFEVMLDTGSLYIDNTKAPTAEILDDKWIRLIREIGEYVHENATLFHIPSIDAVMIEAEGIGFTRPRVTGEIDLTDVKGATIGRIKDTVLETAAAPVSAKAIARVDPLAVDNADTQPRIPVIKTTRPLALEDFATGTGVQRQRIADQDVRHSIQQVDALIVPESAIETKWLSEMKKKVDIIFFDLQDDLGIPSKMIDLRKRLEEEVVTERVKTPALRQLFASSVLLNLSRLKNKYSENTYIKLCSEIRIILSDLVENPPEGLKPNIKKMTQDEIAKVHLMSDIELQKLMQAAPSLEDHPKIGEFLEGKGLTNDIVDFENILKVLISKQLYQLGTHTDLHQITFAATEPLFAIKAYGEKYKEIIKELKKIRSKAEGFFVTRWFRNKDLKVEMTAYFDALERFTYEVIENGIAPAVNNFTMLEFNFLLEKSNK